MTVRSRWASGTPALWVLAVVAVLFFLRYASSLLIPIAMAVLISYALEPLVAWLDAHRIPRVAGTVLVLLAVLGAVAGGAYLLRDDASEVIAAVPRAVEEARAFVADNLGEFGGPSAGGASGAEGGSAGGMLQRAVSAVLGFAGDLVVVFFLVLFLLVSGHHVRDRLIEAAGRDDGRQQTTAAIIDDINRQIQRYLLVLLFTAAIVGTLTWLMLLWMGVQHALMWGILAGIFNSIPYFGPVVVSGGLFVVGLVQGGGMTQALQMAGAAIVITSLEGWLITPPLMGKVERMSALTVFLGLLLWTWLWGGWGTILAVPMLVVVKSVADRVERLKPIGRLMAP